MKTKPLKLRPRRALLLEYRRVKALVAHPAHSTPMDLQNLYGAQQALAWALNDDAMSPGKAFRPAKGR
jgi:hypothetical protein